MNRPAEPAVHGSIPVHPGEDFVRIRFAGDSGDGIQVAGAFLTDSVADHGNDFATFPDFPAEIRAPAGSPAGVSAFSINFGRTEIFTHGDQPDVLVAFNAAALAAHVGELVDGGVALIDPAGFTERLWKRAGFSNDPRTDDSLDGFQVFEIDITAQTRAALEPFGAKRRDAQRARNMWALGFTLWLLDRQVESVAEEVCKRFAKSPPFVEQNLAALRAGHAYGEIHELSAALPRYRIPPAALPAGEYRSVNGAQALSLGMVAGARLAGLPLYYASYPITPASPILHQLVAMSEPDVVTFQAEDEIAAVCAAIGAAYGGGLGVTASSGPGIALMTEALGYAVAVELPLVVIDMQRAGPSTGMPTKPEQADLNLAVYGRSGDAPIPVIAAQCPSDAFECALEAVQIALEYMTPVMLLADAYIGSAAEPWRLPEVADLRPEAFAPRFAAGADGFDPGLRDPRTGARWWPRPGLPGLEHRTGGLERDIASGAVSYDPVNHRRMTEIRTGKTRALREAIPPAAPESGDSTGQLAVVGWGSTYAAIRIATLCARAAGLDVAHIHLRHLSPLPPNIGELLAGYDRVLVPELNMGQLAALLRAETRTPLVPLPKVAGRPFLAREVREAIEREFAR